MRLTLEMNDTKYMIEQAHDEQTVTEMLEIYENLLRQATYILKGHIIVDEEGWDE